jgi:NAD-dependent deacetylase
MACTRKPARCKLCGGTFLKPTVVLFGESMPQAAVTEAFALAREADVVLVVGSSLVVYPAADIPLVALRSRARMIVINAEPTPFDQLAEVVIHGRSGEVPPEIVALIGE